LSGLPGWAGFSNDLQIWRQSNILSGALLASIETLEEIKEYLGTKTFGFTDAFITLASRTIIKLRTPVASMLLYFLQFFQTSNQNISDVHWSYPVSNKRNLDALIESASSLTELTELVTYVTDKTEEKKNGNYLFAVLADQVIN